MKVSEHPAGACCDSLVQLVQGVTDQSEVKEYDVSEDVESRAALTQPPPSQLRCMLTSIHVVSLPRLFVCFMLSGPNENL